MRAPLSIPPWEHSLSFEHVVPERNCYRCYHLQLSQDLFGHWVLVRSWGRIGKPRQQKLEFFLFRFDARQRAQQIIRQRLRHGYCVTTPLPVRDDVGRTVYQ